MKNAPTAYTIAPYPVAETSHLVITARGGAQIKYGEYWYPARPFGLFSIWSRLSLAWEVFTGRADVLRWPGGQ